MVFLHPLALLVSYIENCFKISKIKSKYVALAALIWTSLTPRCTLGGRQMVSHGSRGASAVVSPLRALVLKEQREDTWRRYVPHC